MQGYNRAGLLKRICTHPRRVSRQKAAVLRQEQRNALTPEQQLAWLDREGYVATRERLRLLKQIMERKAKHETK